jgi:hypothetical protein
VNFYFIAQVAAVTLALIILLFEVARGYQSSEIRGYFNGFLNGDLVNIFFNR